MSLLTVNNLEKAFEGETILTGIRFRLEWRQKLGLVGRNGTGKTTLLRMLTGQMEPDRGTINYSPGIRLGYLRQEEVWTPAGPCCRRRRRRSRPCWRWSSICAMWSARWPARRPTRI